MEARPIFTDGIRRSAPEGSQHYVCTSERRLADGRMFVCPQSGASSMLVLDVPTHNRDGSDARMEASIATHLGAVATASARVSAGELAMWCARSTATDLDHDARALPFTARAVDRGLVLATFGCLMTRVGATAVEPVLLEVAPARHHDGSYILRISLRTHVAVVMNLDPTVRVEGDADPIPGEWAAV